VASFGDSLQREQLPNLYYYHNKDKSFLSENLIVAGQNERHCWLYCLVWIRFTCAMLVALASWIDGVVATEMSERADHTFAKNDRIHLKTFNCIHQPMN
jgi:hypothetical protein